MNPARSIHFQRAWWKGLLRTGIALAGFVGLTGHLCAQSVFTNLGAGLPGVDRSMVAWGDYDNDGRLDILLAGRPSSGFPYFGNPITEIWRNTGSGFTNSSSLGTAESGSAVFGDYNNDGWLDIALAGDAVPASEQIWRNTGAGYTNFASPGIPLTTRGGSAWGDFDNDGRLDILLTGQASGNAVTHLCRNIGSGFTNISSGLQGYWDAGVAVADYNNDGWLDVVFAGFAAIAAPISRLWRNTGDGFVVGYPFFAGYAGSVAWGDYNNDGLLDVLLGMGLVYRNTGLSFTNANLGLPVVSNSAAAWGDYDNDGQLDILLTGNTGSNRISQVWRNTGSGFININAGLPGVEFGAVAWGDYDNDGRLDIALTGTTNGSLTGMISQIWRNGMATTNSPPAAPSGLKVALSSSMAILSWNSGSDNETPAAALSYNVRVGTTPGGCDVIAPMSDGNGFRRVPQLGNAQMRTNLTFKYQIGTQYYWSVQAIDGAFAGSPFAVERTFTVSLDPGTIPGDVNGDGMVDESELNTVLANYWPHSPWLRMTNVAGLGGTNVTFALTNATSGVFTVEYSTNLENWTVLGPATPRYQFQDTNAPGQPQRYYRLRWP